MSTLAHLHAGRAMVLKQFEEAINKTVFHHDDFRLAVVGGGHDEVEIEIIRKLIGNITVTSFGIDGTDVYLDLNESDSVSNSLHSVFDLVICCQTLEHIWNLTEAINNLNLLVKQGGHVWVNVPASNMKHGSSDYFSAGYQSNMLGNLFALVGFSSISKGEIGSRRLYLMTHKQRYWPNAQTHKNPFLRGIESRRYLFILKFIRYLFKNLEASFWSAKVAVGSEFSTESWYYGKKINDHA
jgi:hypothetical protein